MIPQQKKQSLMRQQLTQTKRIAKLVNTMEEQGYRFKSLNKVFYISSENAGISQMSNVLNRLKKVNRTELYDYVKEFDYVASDGTLHEVKGKNAVPVGKERTRKPYTKKEQYIESGPADVSLLEELEYMMEQLFNGAVILHPEQHNHQIKSGSNAYGGTAVTEFAVATELEREWRKADLAWTDILESGTKEEKGEVTANIGEALTILTGGVDYNFDSMQYKDFTNKVAELYRVFTSKQLPARYRDLYDDMSPIGTYKEADAYDDKVIDEG